jgi:hypothetical protein
MKRSAKYATAIVVAHLLVNIVHGLATVNSASALVRLPR